MAATAQFIIDIRDNASAGLERIGGSFSSLGNIVAGGLIVDGIKAMGGAIAGFASSSFSVATDFQSQMQRVGAASGATAGEVEQLKRAAIDMGAATVYSASEAGSALFELTAGGMSAQQAIAALPGTLGLAASMGADLATSANAVSNTLSGFGLAADQATAVADKFTVIGANTSATVSDINESMKYVAPVAAGMKISIDDVSTGLIALAKNGIKGSMAGTALRSTFTSLANPSAEAAATMKQLGINVFDATGKLLPFPQLAEQLRNGFQGMSVAQASAAATTIAGKEGMSALMAIMGIAPEQMQEWNNQLINSSGAAQTMADASQTAFDAMKGAVGGAIEKLQIGLGSIAIPLVTSLGNTIAGIGESIVPFVDALGMVASGSQVTGKTLADVTAIAASISPAFGQMVTTFLAVYNATGSIATALSAAIPGFSQFAAFIQQAWTAAQPLVSVLQANLLPVLAGIGAVMGGLVLAALASMAGAALAAAAPFIALAAIGAALAVAWNSNFLGIRDIVTAVFGAIVSVIQSVVAAFAPASSATDQMAAALSTFGTNASSTSAVLASFAGSATTMGGAMTTVASSVSVADAAFTALSTGAQAMATGLTSAISGVIAVLSGLGDLVASVASVMATAWASGGAALVSGVIATFTSVVAAAGSILGGLGTLIGGILSGVASVISANASTIGAAFGAILQYIGTTLSAAGAMIQTIGAAIGAGLAAIAPVASAAMQSVMQVIVSVLSVIASLWAQYGSQIMSTVSAIFAQVAAIVSTAIQVIVTVVRALLPIFTAVFGGIASFISANSSTIVSVLMGAWNTITGVIRAALSLIQGVISATLAALQGNWAGAWQALVGGVLAAGAGIRTALSGITSALVGVGQLALNAALAIGRNIVQGIINGITSTGAGIATAAGNAAKGALSAAKSMLGIRSPSQVMADQVGSQIPAGVAQGISQNSNVIPGAMNEAIGKAIGLIQQGVGAFGALRSFAAVPQQAINDFAAAVTASMDALGGALNAIGGKAAAATGAFAENASKVVGLIGQGVTAFNALSGFSAVPQATLGAFAMQVADAVYSFDQALSAVGMEATVRASAFAQAAQGVVDVIGKGVSAFTALASYQGVADSAIQSFSASLGTAVAAFSTAAEAVGNTAMANASAFAGSAASVVDTIGKGVTAFTALSSYQGVADSAIEAFSASLQTAVAAFASAAEGFSSGMLAQTDAFATTGGKVTEAIAKGVEGFTKLASFAGVAQAAFDSFMAALQMAVAAFAAAGQNVSAESLKAASAIATTATSVVQVIGTGVESFTKLAAFKGVAAGALDGFIASIQAAIQSFANAAASSNQEALAAARKWAQEVGQIAQMISQGVQSFSSIQNAKPFEAVATNLTQAMTAGLEKLKAAVEGGMSAAASALAGSNSKIASASKGMGNAIVQGAAAGVKEKAKELASAAVSAAQSAVSAAKDSLQIRSPSKVANEQIGQPFSQGIAAGITAAAKGINMSALGAVNKVMDVVQKAILALAQLGSVGNVSSGTISKFTTALQQVLQGIVNANKTISGAAVKSAAQFAEGCGKMLALVGQGVDAFNKLATFIAPADSKITAFVGVIAKIVSAFQQALQAMKKQMQKDAQAFADVTTKIVGVVGTGVEAISKLGTLVMPSDKSISLFAEALGKVLDAIIGVAYSMGSSVTSAAASFAESAVKAISIISSGVDAFNKLAGFKGILDSDLATFKTALTSALTMLIALAQKFQGEGLAVAASFAESAGKIIALIGTGVDNLTKLSGFKGVTDDAFASFKSSLTKALTTIVNLVGTWEQTALAAAAQFAEQAGKIVGLFGSASDAFGKLADIQAVPASAFESFAASLKSAISAIAATAKEVTSGAAQAAASFAESASKVVSLLSAGSDAFKKLNDVGAVSDSAIQAFAANIKAAILGLKDVIAAVGSELPSQAATFAESITKVMSLISAGSDAFKKLVDLAAVPDSAITAFATALKSVLEQLRSIVSSWDADSLKAAQAFGESVQKLLAMISAGTDAFKKLADLAAVPDEAIAAFASALTRVLTALKDTFSTWDADALKAAQSFGDAIQKVLSMLATGTDAFKKLADLTDIPDSAVSAFASALNRTVTALKDMFAAWDADALKAAQQFGDSIQKVLSMLSSGVDAFKKLADLAAVPDSAITAFATALNTTITKLQATFSTWSSDALDAAKTFGDAVQKVLAMVSTGSDAFKKLAELSAVPESAIDTFVQGLKAAMNALTKISTLWSTDALNQAKAFSESVQKVMAAFAAGASAFIKIAENHDTMPTGSLQALAQAMNAALTILASLALTWTKDALAYAESYAESVKKVMASLKESSQAFKSMKDFQGVPVKAIQGLADAIQTTVTTIYQIANQTGEMIDAATQFMSAASGTLTALGLAVNGFGALEKFKAIPPKLMAAFKDALTETITLLSGLSAQWSADAMTAIKDFTVATGAVLSALKDSVDGFAKISSFKDTPSKAISALAAAIEQVVSGISALASQVSSEMMDAATSFATSTNTVLDSLVQAIDAFKKIGAFKEAPTKAVEALRASLSTVLSAIQGLASQWSGDALSAATSFASGALDVVKSVKDAMDAIASIGNYKDQASGIVSSFSAALSKIVSEVKSTAIPQAEALGKAITQGVADGISAGTSTVTSAVADLVAAIKKALESATSAAKDAGSAIAAAIANSLKSAASSASTSSSAIASTISSAMKSAASAAQAGASAISSAFKSAMSQATSAAKTGAGAIQSTIQSAMKAAASAAQSGGNAISTAFKSSMASAVTAVRSGMASALSAVRSSVSGFAGAGQSVGSSLASGISRGISGAVGSISSSAANAVRSAVNAARSAAQINSPSRLAAMRVGLPLGQGIAMGLDRSLPAIIAAGRGAATAGIQPTAYRGGNIPIAGGGGGKSVNLTVHAYYTKHQDEKSLREDMRGYAMLLGI